MKTTIRLTKEHFEELIKKGYNLDQIFLLTLVKQGHDLEVLIKDNIKIEALHIGLIRKGLLNDQGTLTLLGHELLDFLDTNISTKLVRKQPSTQEFKDWWDVYPKTDQFENKGRIFTGSRGMRVKEEECKLKFNAIINEGIYTAKDIIEATKYIVLMKKEASIKKKSNELTYLQNSLTFLNGGHFKDFVELAKKGIVTEQQEPTGGTDV